MFEYEYNGKKTLKMLIYYVLFRKYKQAFQGTKENHTKIVTEVNAFQIDKDGMRITFLSFMNFADFDFLLNQHPGTQAPCKRTWG
jgi:hypothetical protein